jgi:ribosomal protein S11
MYNNTCNTITDRKTNALARQYHGTNILRAAVTVVRAQRTSQADQLMTYAIV